MGRDARGPEEGGLPEGACGVSPRCRWPKGPREHDCLVDLTETSLASEKMFSLRSFCSGREEHWGEQRGSVKANPAQNRGPCFVPSPGGG